MTFWPDGFFLNTRRPPELSHIFRCVDIASGEESWTMPFPPTEMTCTLAVNINGRIVGGGVSVALSKKGFKLHPSNFTLRAAFVHAFMRHSKLFHVTSVISCDHPMDQFVFFRFYRLCGGCIEAPCYSQRNIVACNASLKINLLFYLSSIYCGISFFEDDLLQHKHTVKLRPIGDHA